MSCDSNGQKNLRRPRKILTPEDLEKNKQKIFVRETIKRILNHVESREIDWIVESAVVKSWIKKYSIDFVKSFCLPDFLAKTDSLRPLTGDWGRSFLLESWNLWEFEQEKQREAARSKIELSDKIGADIQIIKKAKTLKDFIG